MVNTLADTLRSAFGFDDVERKIIIIENLSDLET